ncbi:MAG: type II CRISPR-associated endonuclease Cas1 [Treponema sp.]|nr:type II CRISPR-associated endonuclease Cas1 [Treponema sp.]
MGDLFTDNDNPMIPRIVDVSENGRFIAKHRGFITIKQGNEFYGEVPLDDIGVLMISAFGATCTKEALVSLADRGAVTILCGSKGLPSALVLPVNANYESALRVRLQSQASQPLKKRLWQAIVTAKLKHQSEVLRFFGKQVKADQIEIYSRQVQSGDSKNREASGARLYWKALFGDIFSRSPVGDWPNALLNYGYTLLRACAARAICATGLNPIFGIHHQNDTNPFPLADDIMEPYRPLVDYFAKQVLATGITEMNSTAKQMIGAFLWADLYSIVGTTPLYTAMERLAFSLVSSFKTKKPQIEIAEIRLSKNDTSQLI